MPPVFPSQSRVHGSLTASGEVRGAGGGGDLLLASPAAPPGLPEPPRPPLPPAPDAPARFALGVTSRARSRPAAGGRCTAAPRSHVPGVAGLPALEQRRLRLPAAAARAARTPVGVRAAPPCHAEAAVLGGGSLSAWRLPGQVGR